MGSVEKGVTFVELQADVSVLIRSKKYMGGVKVGYWEV